MVLHEFGHAIEARPRASEPGGRHPVERARRDPGPLRATEPLGRRHDPPTTCSTSTRTTRSMAPTSTPGRSCSTAFPPSGRSYGFHTPRTANTKLSCRRRGLLGQPPRFVSPPSAVVASSATALMAITEMQVQAGRHRLSPGEEDLFIQATSAGRYTVETSGPLSLVMKGLRSTESRGRSYWLRMKTATIRARNSTDHGGPLRPVARDGVQRALTRNRGSGCEGPSSCSSPQPG